MTIEQIENLIVFSARKECDFGGFEIIGELKSITAGQRFIDIRNEDFAKENIRQRILGALYDDRRSEMAEALNEFLRWWYPAAHEEAFLALEKVKRLARFAPLKMNEPKP